jgi:hypothetical protein
MVDPGDHPGHGELLLRQQRDHQVVLVVAGGGHHHVDRTQVSLPQRRHLTGVDRAPLDTAAAVTLGPGERRCRAADHGRVLFEHQHLVTGQGEVVGDELADVPGAGDGHLHVSDPSPLRAVR